jgi:hypothetical protein
MTKAEIAQQAPESISSHQDLLELQRDIEDLSMLNLDGQERLMDVLSTTLFTNRVVAAIEHYGLDGYGSGYLSSSHTEAIGLFTGQVIERSDEHSGSVRYLELCGQKNNAGLFDYKYTIRMGIWPHHTASLEKHERDQLDNRRALQVRYFKDGETVNLSDDESANEAFRLVQISLAELIAAVHPIEIHRRKTDGALERAKRRSASVLGELASELRLN